MEPSSPPSIMGAENPKFTVSTLERRAANGQAMSDSESMDLGNHLHDAMSTSMMSARKSKDGLTRDERMKVVRERQLEEHRRRLDELRQAQMQAMRAKQQLDTQRRRRVEEMKSKDEQRRAAVEERRKRLEDAEQNRREAILRKHQEIFERIDQKRRQHESRRAAFGQQQQSPNEEGYPSRRAVSVGVLSGRGSLMTRSHHHSHVFSPGSAASARYQASPSTPSRTGGLLESVSGNSSENSPVHNGRHGKHFRITQSHPPPTQRNRTREKPTPRRLPVGMAASVHTDGSKTERASAARRPTSLVTRGRDDSDLSSKLSTSRSSDTFKILSKRSQSVGNVNGRKAEPMALNGRPVEPVDGESAGESEETGNRRKITSEAEAKAALAEKRRLARLKAEAERMELVTPSSRGDGEAGSPAYPVDEQSPRKGERSQSIVMFEQDEARMAQVRSSEDLTQDQTDASTIVRDEAPEETEARPERVSTPEVEDREEQPAQTVADEPEPVYYAPVETETVVQPDVIPNQKVEERSASPPSDEEAPPTVTTVVDDVERQREETERRRLEMEQREEEERTLRRQRLEAIKRLTKGAGGAPPERLVSPQVETRADAMENARKLLQRRGMGSGAQSPVTTPGEGETEEKTKVNGISVNGTSGDADFDPFASNGAPAAWEGAEHKKADPWGPPNGHMTLTANSDLLLNFE